MKTLVFLLGMGTTLGLTVTGFIVSMKNGILETIASLGLLFLAIVIALTTQWFYLRK